MFNLLKSILAAVSLVTVTAIFCTAQLRAQVSGGTVRIAVSDGFSTEGIDPYYASSDFMFLVLAGMVGDTLTVHSTSNQVVGELAESWTFSDDFTTWKFKLRTNVRFHSGKPLDAQDVVFSFNRFADLDNLSDVSAYGSK